MAINDVSWIRGSNAAIRKQVSKKYYHENKR